MEVVDFEIVRGDDFSRVLQFRQNGTPINIATWTMNAQLRSEPDADIKTTIAVVAVDAGQGTVRITLTPAQTAVLKGVYVWDLERTVSGAKLTTVGGTMRILADVTRIEV